MESLLYISIMTKTADDRLTSSARRASLVDGIPVITLGGLTLGIGADPDQSASITAVWVALSAAFTLSIVWVFYRAFRRADEYQRKIQLESMAVAFGAVMVGLSVVGLLDAIDVGELKAHVQMVFIGGVMLWLVLVDLRTRFHR
jgi:drug/metabolite transporter (DMT)-like permease